MVNAQMMVTNTRIASTFWHKYWNTMTLTIVAGRQIALQYEIPGERDENRLPVRGKTRVNLVQ